MSTQAVAQDDIVNPTFLSFSSLFLLLTVLSLRGREDGLDGSVAPVAITITKATQVARMSGTVKADNQESSSAGEGMLVGVREGELSSLQLNLAIV